MKKNILFICTDPASGMIHYATTLINTVFHQNEYNVHAIVVSKGELSYDLSITERRIRVNTIFLEASENKIVSFINKLFPISLYHLIKKVCKQKDIDIIHCLTTEFSLAFFLPALQRKYKIIYTVHDLFPHETVNKSLKKKIIQKIIKYGVSRNINSINNLVTSSSFQKKVLENLFPSKNVFYHSFPTLITKEVNEGTCICPELENISNYILFFGTLDFYKGVEYLYRAYIDNPEILLKYPLVLAGIGGWYFKREIEKEGNVVRINRFIKDAEVKNLFKNAICVVYPYISATQSGVLSLAYYFQTPLIATDVEYFKENIVDGKSGYLCKRRDLDDICNKLKLLLENTDLKLMKHFQEQLYNSQYNDKKLNEELSFIYQSCTK